MVSSLLMSFAPATVRCFATGAKGTSSNSTATKEEKSIIDFVLGSLTKQDQFYETNPLLKKVDEKEGGTGGNGGRKTVSGGKNSVAVPQKKNGGGFGGLFAKK
ncbi:hypothetical protein EUTSA_v10015099mg [Eutrema salsugineum]|uniref:Thylakoid soluble phosphoprotein TSP9 n=1 Tax=Eutrema salsugineum TaxID=72664 RepID=V4LRM1_EUTSA|nr:uncharacterized protein LOC18018713 [Eutrema salsugineum]ESQ42483.1 hypothetical protein EUTSA_v10015099mg [Eutrema salsugineum]